MRRDKQSGQFIFQDSLEKQAFENLLLHPGWEVVERSFEFAGYEAQQLLNNFTGVNLSVFEVGRCLGELQRAVDLFQEVLVRIREAQLPEEFAAGNEDVSMSATEALPTQEEEIDGRKE